MRKDSEQRRSHTRSGIPLAISAACLLAAFGPVPVRAQAPGIYAIPADDAVDGDSQGDVTVKGGIALRSAGGELGLRLQTAIQTGVVPIQNNSNGGQGQSGNGSHSSDSVNVQVNDPALDHVVTIAGTRPFEFSTQSETSVTSNGQHILVGYNSSAKTVVEKIGTRLFFTQVLLSGYSVSHDGGKSWTSGFLPSVSPAVPITLGDPSVAKDRQGNFFYASLGVDGSGRSALIVNKSSDNGNSFGAATVVAVDSGSDKEWLAIGPDPGSPQRDNLYVTWTSFRTNSAHQTIASQLWLARSTDGGVTWSSKALFAPVDDGVNSSFIQFSNPVVDASTGRLYVPFLHFSDGNADNVRVLVSDDGGVTFHFLAFNVPGAPDAFAFPNVTPGAINDCGPGGFRNILHQGSSLGPGRLPGSFRYVQATRLVTQPSAAAFRGRVVIALQSSTSAFFGDPAAGSFVQILYSQDGGSSWAAPLVIAPSTSADPQHVHPSIALEQNGNQATVAYYVQQADGRLRTDVATLHVNGNHLRLDQTSGLSTTPFDLTPNNIPLNPSGSITTNYDRLIASCYDIGEYLSVTGNDSDNKGAYAAWGDNRNTWTGPPGSAAPYTHAQPDVFFEQIE